MNRSKVEVVRRKVDYSCGGVIREGGDRSIAELLWFSILRLS